MVHFFIGIDISKLTLDVALVRSGEVIAEAKIANTVKAVTDMLTGFRKQFKCTAANSFLCAEKMGIYGNFLLIAARKKKYTLCLENPLHLKRSLGIVRGKSDRIDAARIAQYAATHHPSLRVWEPPSPVISQLKALSTLRKQLVRMNAMFGSNDVLDSPFLDRASRERLGSMCSHSQTALRADIERVETAISHLIDSDETLHRQYQLMMTVPNIGRVIATAMLIATEGFSQFPTARKFASYCGIAPFSYSSGTSVQTRPHVSAIANKELKSLLHLASMSSVRQKGSALSAYYQRKVAEGKPKMSVLNAVRNKLVQYIYACVRDNCPFGQGSAVPGIP